MPSLHSNNNSLFPKGHGVCRAGRCAECETESDCDTTPYPRRVLRKEVQPSWVGKTARAVEPRKEGTPRWLWVVPEPHILHTVFYIIHCL